MTNREFDLFVIGAGSGGVRASRTAASLGARVGLAESNYLGGTCVNVGCVPKKLTFYAAQVAEAVADAAGYGWDLSLPSIDWPRFVARRTAEVRRLNDVYRQLLANAGVRLFEDRAHLVDRHTIAVGDELIKADQIVIATGACPRKLNIPGANHMDTSDDVFGYTTLPRRVIIAGGGYIGVEFASLFCSLGVDVIQVHRGDQLLRGFDNQLRQTLSQTLAERGVDFRFDTTIERVDQGGDQCRALLSDGSTESADRIVCAVGRSPNTQGLGLETIGVALGAKGEIQVDPSSRSAVENIWAIGDCTDRRNLTPVAVAEGQAVATTIVSGVPSAVDYAQVATAVFSHPSVAMVGLTEQAAREHYEHVAVFRSHFKPMKQSLAERGGKNFFKLIVDRDTDRVLGCHLISDEAPELIQLVAVAMRCGMTKTQLNETIAVHPTTAEELVLMHE